MSMPGAFSPELPPSKAAPEDAKSNNPPPLRLDQPNDAYSLHTNDPYFDNPAAASSSAALDLPPSYTDDPAAEPPIPSLLLADEHAAPNLFRRDPATGNEIHISKRLDTDPAYLESFITSLAQLPPRPYVRVRGTHSSTVHKSENKTESKTVVDFDLRLDLTPFLYRDISARQSWRDLRTADNFSKVRRGTVFPTRAPGFGGSSSAGGVVEGSKPPTCASGATATAPPTPA
ncbi:hypothetical protein CGLO_00413 [Colletotrichum gloeosporioides Cg-14]|uniref:Uncharacterized protein n=1 Tax=Colletotrichum gloeosporioides (strain Cg-14) TaxID=1237896 RepID=T0L405_COLGC|nr:hypothetical protein CGLO_00413 [Colletotrichum gloeosporioides Cg-14]